MLKMSLKKINTKVISQYIIIYNTIITFYLYLFDIKLIFSRYL